MKSTPWQNTMWAPIPVGAQVARNFKGNVGSDQRRNTPELRTKAQRINELVIQAPRRRRRLTLPQEDPS